MSEMKLIMERWDRFILEEETTAGDYVDKIKRDLYIISAKLASVETFKFVVEEFGEDIVNASLDAIGTLPIVGNVASGLRGLWTTGKLLNKGFNAVRNAKEIVGPAVKLLQIAAGEYIGHGANDAEANKSYIGKLLNIDDPTEEITDEGHLNKFASLLIQDLSKNRDEEISDPDRYAEQKLANYLVNLKAYKQVEPN
jgi:hypothetical protein